MSVLLAAGGICFACLIIPRFRLLLAVRSESRFGQIPTRIFGTIKFALGQRRMPRDPIAGIAHICIFSGFLVVSIATIKHFAHAYAPDWHFPGLSGTAGLYYALVKDIFEILVLFGVSRTGEVLAPPAFEPVKTFPVRVHAGMIQVGVER